MEPNILLPPSGNFWILSMLCSLFQRKAIPLSTPAVNAFSNTSKKNKQTANAILPSRNCSFLYWSIWKDTTIRKDHTSLLACLPPAKQRLCTGNRMLRFLLDNFILFCVYLLDFSPPFWFFS